MKILHVNYADSGGGASIAAFRLHSALKSEGMESQLLCRKCRTGDTDVVRAGRWLSDAVNSAVNVSIKFLMKKIGYPEESSLNFFPGGLHKKINRSDADIVHLHWINGELINIGEVAKIKKPVVWSFHDLWPLLGTEHYPKPRDRRYVDGYHDKDRRERLNRLVWRYKAHAWKDFNPTVFSVGNWGAYLAKESHLFRNARIHVLPNTINAHFFLPRAKSLSRKLFSLPLDKHLILFGATGGTVDPRKGFDLLIDSLSDLEIDSNTVELVVFGGAENSRVLECQVGYKIHHVGRIRDPDLLVSLYSAANVICVPSRMETFGQTALEAMACGVPVVAFAATGLLDVVDHKENGYLADPYDTSDFARGIEWILSRKNSLGGASYDELCRKAREKVLACFDYPVVARQAVSLYKQVLEESSLKNGI